MSKRIVDALEFVDIDIDHRELLAFRNPREFAFQSLVEQRAVRQIGQRVVMRKMRDALFDAPALGDVLERRHPSAIGKRTVQDLDRAPVGGIQDRLKYFPSAIFSNSVEQYCSTSPLNDPVALRCSSSSRMVQPGFTTSVETPNIST